MPTIASDQERWQSQVECSCLESSRPSFGGPGVRIPPAPFLPFRVGLSRLARPLRLSERLAKFPRITGATIHSAVAEPVAAPAAPVRPQFEIVPRKGLPLVGAALVLVIVAIAVNNTWLLMFVHVAGGAAWTIIDLFLGLVLGPIWGGCRFLPGSSSRLSSCRRSC